MSQFKKSEKVDYPNFVGSVLIILTGMFMAAFSVVERDGKFMDSFKRTGKKTKNSTADKINVN